MAEVPRWFPKDIEELYRLEPGERASIRDPRVATSHGGGACPEQHWGVLTDGRVFYFRYRHGWASVTLAPHWYEPGRLPAYDLRTSHEQWQAAYDAELARVNGVFEDVRDDALPRLWMGPAAGYEVTEDNIGWFSSQQELDEAFAACLDQVWNEPFDEEGWELQRQDMANWPDYDRRQQENVKRILDDL